MKKTNANDYWWPVHCTLLIICIMLATQLLSGCSSGGVMDISKLPVSDETITSITGSITDTSVQKEAIYSDMVKNRDKLYRSMYAQSGFSVKFKLEEVAPGVKIQVMEQVTFRESPRFGQPLPTGPSEHPAWRVTEKVATKAMDTFLWWTGITKFFDSQNAALAAAQPKYYGNYNPQTAAPYVVDPVIVNPVIVQ